MADVRSRMLGELGEQLDPLEDLYALIDRAIAEEPPIQLRDGGVIRTGYHPRVDELRALLSDTKGTLARIEAEERAKTGIKNLKIGYNKVFGYYIEVSKSNLAMVPGHYIRKQTLTGGERYITEDLKRLESEILSANEQLAALEYELFEAVRETVVKNLHRVQRTASALAWIDLFVSFAQTAAENGYCCPTVDLSGVIEIEEGRHPVVERLLREAPFVSNDCRMDMDANRIFVITGPNMAGKSTYMRQVALITLMAQIGSFVPAASAKIGVVDAIFTRVGASDDLASGQSTFMVEMNEVANILEHATEKSLIILDEIGRGTSTYDGMSIARAVVEYIADRRKIGAKTLFATHYHELTELENQIAGVVNFNIAVKKRGDDITFLRRIVRGGADESYGIEVAKLSGIPNWVVERAKAVLASLEKGKALAVSKRLAAEPAAEPAPSPQLSFLAAENDRIRARLRAVDLNTLTPIEALNLLYELRAMAD